MPSGPFCDLPYPPKSPGKTTRLLLARCLRRHLLCAQKRLSLATFTPRLSSVVYRLLPFQKVPLKRVVAQALQGPARSREEEGGQGSPTDGGHHGFPER